MLNMFVNLCWISSVNLCWKLFSTDVDQKPKQTGKFESEVAANPPISNSSPEKPVVDLNSLEETKMEIKERLASFQHITENTFLCER